MSNQVHHRTMKIFFTVLFVLNWMALYSQISIHSITTNRMPTGDNGYTLDGHRMVDSRAKLLNPANFGPQGTYPKTVNIYDGYETSGSLVNVSGLPTGTILFFGSFQTNNASLASFTQAELDSLYNWSVRGGKVMIAAGSSQWNLGVLGENWGFNVMQDNPSYFIPNEIGLATNLFNGPFGFVASSNQGGGAQGYFDEMPENASVLATDDEGNPTLIIDCKTMDLIAADVDGFTNYNQSQGPNVVNDKDKFFANIFAFIDQVENPPSILENEFQLSVSAVGPFQWYYNDEIIEDATDSVFDPTEPGVYRVETQSVTGCRVSSNDFVIDTLPDYEYILTFPNVLTPNGDGLNDILTPKEHFRVNLLQTKIYNRWGRIIKSIDGEDEFWDCTNRNGDLVSSGTYYFTVFGETLTDRPVELKGTVSIIR